MKGRAARVVSATGSTFPDRTASRSSAVMVQTEPIAPTLS
jgi:hypothetical protein